MSDFTIYFAQLAGRYFLILGVILLVLLSYKAAIFRAAKLREQIHEGDLCIRTRWWIWIAWLWRRVNCVLLLSLRV